MVFSVHEGTKGGMPGRKFDEKCNIFHGNQSIFELNWNKKTSTESKYLRECFTHGYLQIRGSSEQIISIILKSPDSISWLLLPRSTQGQPCPHHLSFTSHSPDITWHRGYAGALSEREGCFCVNSYFCYILGFFILESWQKSRAHSIRLYSLKMQTKQLCGKPYNLSIQELLNWRCIPYFRNYLFLTRYKFLGPPPPLLFFPNKHFGTFLLYRGLLVHYLYIIYL